MPTIPVRAVRSLLFVLFAISACATSREADRPELPACPGFRLNVDSIVVGPAGGPFPLTQNGQTRITFAPNAVTTQTTFYVSPVVENGDTLAGVGFTPSYEFSEPVVLRISYAGCPSILQKDTARLHIVTRDGTGSPWTKIGGAKSMQQKYVEAIISHFTDFAIAL